MMNFLPALENAGKAVTQLEQGKQENGKYILLDVNIRVGIASAVRRVERVRARDIGCLWPERSTSLLTILRCGNYILKHTTRISKSQ
jgi:hypothetical protein